MDRKNKGSIVALAVLVAFVLALLASNLVLLSKLHTRSSNTDIDVVQAIPVSAVEQNKLLYTLDSDRDGYSDIAEALVGRDPYSADKYDKTHPVTFEIGIDEMTTLKLEGTPNIVDTYFEEYSSPSIQNKCLMLSPVYELYNPNFKDNIYSAELTLTYKGDPDEDVAIYQYLDDGALELVENSVVSGNTVTATLEHFSKYTVARRVLEDISTYSERAFALCIDDSGSMFENSMQRDSEGKTHGNDPDGVRWDFACQFYDTYSNDDIVCYSYTASVTELFGVNRTEAAKKEILNNWRSTIHEVIGLSEDELDADPLPTITNNRLTWNGTHTGKAVVSALNELEKVKAKTKYLIILTDGNDTVWIDTSGFESALQKSDVIPICIALGTDVNFEGIGKYVKYNNGQTIWMNNTDVFAELDYILGTVMTGVEPEVSKALSEAFGGNIQVETLADSGYRKEKDSIPFLNTDWKSKASKASVMEGCCFGYAYTEQERYLTGLTYKQKPAYSYNPLVLYLHTEAKLLFPEINLKYLTSSNYSEVLEYLRTIIGSTRVSQYETNGIAVILTDTSGTRYRVATARDTDFVKTFFALQTFTYEHGPQKDSSGKLFAGYEDYYPVYDVILNAVKSDFKDYPWMTDVQKASVEWLNLLIYNFERQNVGDVVVRALGNSLYGDISTVGGFFYEWGQSIGTGKNHYDGAFPDDKMAYTMMSSVYNQLKAGVPAMVDGTGDGGHAMLCSRMFRDTTDPTIIYLELDDSNDPFAAQYLRLDFQTIFRNALPLVYATPEELREGSKDDLLMCLTAPCEIKFSMGYNFSYLFTTIDTPRLKDFGGKNF